MTNLAQQAQLDDPLKDFSGEVKNYAWSACLIKQITALPSAL